MLSRENICYWSTTDRRCSNYIWVNSNFIAYKRVPYIRGLGVGKCAIFNHSTNYITTPKQIKKPMSICYGLFCICRIHICCHYAVPQDLWRTCRNCSTILRHGVHNFWARPQLPHIRGIPAYTDTSSGSNLCQHGRFPFLNDYLYWNTSNRHSSHVRKRFVRAIFQWLLRCDRNTSIASQLCVTISIVVFFSSHLGG